MEDLLDLRTSNIVHGSDNANTWVTRVQSFCRVRSNTGMQFFYLGYPCRAEKMLERSSNNRIFERYYEFVNVAVRNEESSGEASSYFMRSGHGVKGLLPPSHDGKITSHVHVKHAQTKEVGFDEMYELLSEHPQESPDYYARISWDNGKQSILTKLDYINYSNDGGAPYIQPITGQVLLMLEEKPHVAYVALSLNGTSQPKVEFVIRQKTGFFNVARGFSSKKLSWLKPLLNTLLPLQVDEYSKPLVVDADVCIFTYQ